jgi:AcrR family transcriptional regulator
MEGSFPTREALLNAGIRLFSKKGFNGTSVKEICEEAGVNVSLISYHFEGKNGLYRACLEEFGEARLKVAQRILVPPKSREEFKLRLELFAEDMLLCQAEQPEHTRVVQRDIALELDPAQDIFRKTFLQIFQGCVKFFESAQDQGFIRKDLDPLVVVSLWVGSLFHVGYTDALKKRYFHVTIQNKEFRQSVVRHLVEVYLNGILATDA